MLDRQNRYRKAFFRQPKFVTVIDDEAEEAASDDSDIADANIPPALQYVVYCCMHTTARVRSLIA